MTATRVIHSGDTQKSCVHCRYYTGHTSWCPVGRTEDATGQAMDGDGELTTEQSDAFRAEVLAELRPAGRLRRAAAATVLGAAVVLAAPGTASAAPAMCGNDCGTDAPYGINTLMEQKLRGQTATGTAKTQTVIESALANMREQLSTVTGGLL